MKTVIVSLASVAFLMGCGGNAGAGFGEGNSGNINSPDPIAPVNSDAGNGDAQTPMGNDAAPNMGTDSGAPMANDAGNANAPDAQTSDAYVCDQQCQMTQAANAIVKLIAFVRAGKNEGGDVQSGVEKLCPNFSATSNSAVSYEYGSATESNPEMQEQFTFPLQSCAVDGFAFSSQAMISLIGTADNYRLSSTGLIVNAGPCSGFSLQVNAGVITGSMCGQSL